jgi:hypothetical protein
MGGETAEMSGTTTRVLVEAAHWDATSMFRTGRRHRLTSEAGKRNERGVDPEICEAAADRVVELLVELGGATADPGVTVVGTAPAPVSIEIPVGLPAKLSGIDIDADTTVEHLRAVGCEVSVEGDTLTAVVPSWRPDLTDPYDWWRRWSGSSATTRSPRCCRRPQRDVAVPTSRSCVAGWASRSQVPGWSRRSAIPSSARTTGCDSACGPTTIGAPRCESSTRSTARSRCLPPPCYPACSRPWPATSAGETSTQRCSRPAWCSCPAVTSGRRSSASTDDPVTRSGPASRRRSRGSRGTSPLRSLVTPRSLAGGARVAARRGPTLSARSARSVQSWASTSTS